MAEAVGLAASGIAIGTLAAQITNSVVKLKSYYDQIQDAPEDLRDVVEELEIFQHLLADIEDDRKRNPISSLIFDSTSMSECLKLCNQGVDRLREITNNLGTDIEASKKIRRRWSSAKIVFKKDKIDRYRKKLQRATRLLGFAHQLYSSFLWYQYAKKKA